MCEAASGYPDFLTGRDDLFDVLGKDHALSNDPLVLLWIFVLSEDAALSPAQLRLCTAPALFLHGAFTLLVT